MTDALSSRGRAPCTARLLLLGALVAAAALPGSMSGQNRSWVSGLVRDQQARPVAGATVELLRTAYPGIPSYQLHDPLVALVPVATVETDDRGRFLLRHALHGGLAVVARDGTKRRSITVTPVAPGASLELVLHDVRRITGRAVGRLAQGDGSFTTVPLANVAVAVTGPHRSAVPGYHKADGALTVLDTVRTDAEGRFELAALAGLPATVTAGRPLGVAGRVSIAATEDTPVQLEKELVSVAVEVVTPDGAPVAGASTWHEVQPNPPTDAEGKARWLLGSSDTTTVFAPGYRSDHVKLDGPTARIVLRAEPQQRVRLVRGEAPLPEVDLHVLSLAVGERGSGPQPWRLRTDPQGSASIPGVRRDWGCAVWIREEDRFRRAFDLGRASEAQDFGDLDLTARTCEGTVLDEDGVPAAHIPLFVLPESDPFGGRMPLAQYAMHFTDHAGRFRIRLLGDVPRRIAVRSPSSLTSIADWVPGRTGALRIELEPAKRFEGVVVDARGNPLQGAYVTAVHFETAEELRPFGLWSTTTVTDAEGRFQLSAVVAEREHTLSAQLRGARAESNRAVTRPGVDGLELAIDLPR